MTIEFGCSTAARGQNLAASHVIGLFGDFISKFN